MTVLTIGLASIGGIFLLVHLGVYVAAALGAVAFVDVWMVTSNFQLLRNLLYLKKSAKATDIYYRNILFDYFLGSGPIDFRLVA